MPSRTKKDTSILGDTFQGEANKVYVYRDKGNGRPDGSYLKIYDTVPVEKHQIERDLGPGMYVLIGNVDGAMQKKQIHVGGEIPGATSQDEWLTKMRQIVEMKIMGDQLAPNKPDYLEVIRTVGELIRPQGNAGIDNFYEGVSFGSQATPSPAEGLTPETLLTSWGLSQANESKNDGQLKQVVDEFKKTVGIFAQKFQVVDKTLAALNRKIEETTFDAGENPDAQGEEKVRHPMDIYSLLFDLPDDVASDPVKIVSYLKLADKVTDGQMKTDLAKMKGRGLDAYIRAALESKNRAQFAHQFIEAANMLIEGREEPQSAGD